MCQGVLFTAEERMKVSLLAGKPADPASLIDVSILVPVCFTQTPDPAILGQQHTGIEVPLEANRILWQL